MAIDNRELQNQPLQAFFKVIKLGKDSLSRNSLENKYVDGLMREVKVTAVLKKLRKAAYEYYVMDIWSEYRPPRAEITRVTRVLREAFEAVDGVLK